MHLRHVLVLAPLLGACAGRPVAPPVATLDVPPLAGPKSKPPEAPATCDTPERVLRRAGSEIALTAYVPVDDAHREVIARLHEIADRWSSLSHGLVKTEFVDTSAEGARQAAKDLGIQVDVDGVSGVEIRYRDGRETLKRLSPSQLREAEALLLLKVREAVEKVDGVKLRVGVVTGHDEIGLSESNLVPGSMAGGPTMAKIISQYFPALDLVDVDLRKGDADASLEALVVTQPEKDWSDAELRRLDAFAMRGKHLVVAASAVELPYGASKMQAKLVSHGLEKVLAGYGIEQRKDVVLDFDASFTVSLWTTNGAQSTKFPPVLEVKADRMDRTFPLVMIESIAFPLASSLVLDPRRQPDARFRVLARSTAETVRDTGATVDLSPTRQWARQGGEGEQVLAAVVDGTLKSAFGAGKSQRPAHVLVLSSAQIFANPFARAGAPPKTSPRSALMAPTGDETLEALAMPYAQQHVTNAILAAKTAILDWAAHDEDISCLLP